MRKRSDQSERFKWWRDALMGVAPSPVLDHPECGFYKRRLVKGGPWVPVAIWIEAETDEAGDLLGPEIIKCSVDGSLADPCTEWSYCCDHPITREEFERRKKNTINAKREGDYNPRMKIDLLTVQPPSFKREEDK